VPLWRSDDSGNALNEQCHSYGIAFWLPYHGSGVSPGDVYTLRSGMLPSYLVILQVVSGSDATMILAKRMMRERRAFADDLLGDYYPLTPYSLDTNVWMAWQFDRPEAGTGVVQAFRRDTSTVGSMRFKLRGLDAAARYELNNFDVTGSTRAVGHELMTRGLSVRLASAPGAATITYKRVTHV
jgi:alpha-galactosidase